MNIARKRPLCPFGEEIKLSLIIKSQTQSWLIEELKKETRQYIDTSLLHKILTGENRNIKITSAIEKILDIKKG